MFQWLTGTVIGKMCATFFISMLPVVELRFGLPYGIALGLEYPLALMAALLGNMIPVPFIIVYIKRIFEWMRKHMPRMNALVAKLENRAHAWTGALIAALLNIRTSKAVPVILIGVCIAAAIMTLITYGVIHIVV